jgi:hypothetical protein
VHDLPILRSFQVRLTRLYIAAALILGLSSGVAAAETLGLSFAGSNDSLGDWYDRWNGGCAAIA